MSVVVRSKLRIGFTGEMIPVEENVTSEGSGKSFMVDGIGVLVLRTRRDQRLEGNAEMQQGSLSEVIARLSLTRDGFKVLEWISPNGLMVDPESGNVTEGAVSFIVPIITGEGRPGRRKVTLMPRRSSKEA